MMRTAAILGSLAATVVFACTGNDTPFVPQTPGAVVQDGGPPPTNGVINVAPDAAPSKNCPEGCAAPPPSGWDGPISLYDGPNEGAPTTCEGAYGTLIASTKQDVTFSPPQCACEAPTFAGQSCNVTLRWFDGVGCANDKTVANAKTGDCVVTKGDHVNASSTGQTLGTCTFAKRPAPSTPTFGRVQLACAQSAAVACGAQPECVATPPPTAPFTKMCIHKDGPNEACPSADYPARFVAHRKVNDTRACSECKGTPAFTCGPASGALAVFDSAACADPLGAVALPGCASLPSDTNSVRVMFGPEGLSCTKTSGGEASGTVTLEEAVTFCCRL